MSLQDTRHGLPFRPAPNAWAANTAGDLSSRHQLSPYIGKLKPAIARDLVLQYSKPGELVVDPFCGSGTIPLEAAIAGRRVLAADTSPYAYLLTMAKLSPVTGVLELEGRAADAAHSAKRRPSPDLRKVPTWVRAFFHPETLRQTIRIADECMERRDWLLLGALLGILHHQRPGFLSYPSSHLVPYLRERKFPRGDYPELYEQRAVLPRLVAKLGRFMKGDVALSGEQRSVQLASIESLEMPRGVDCIITSPPYMNALDYRRDNRLRLWFLDRATADYFPEPTDKPTGLATMVDVLAKKSVSSLRRGGVLVLVVGEMVFRKRVRSHPSVAFAEAVLSSGKMSLKDAIRDEIPDIRRSRRDCRGTKAEHILVFSKN